MHSQEIETLRLKNGEPIPRLDRLLQEGRENPQAIFNIELKADNSVFPVIETMHKSMAAGYIRLDQIILSSFNHQALLLARQKMPDIKIGALFSLETQIKNLLYPWSDNVTAFYTPFAKDCLADPLLRQIDPDFFNLALETTSIRNLAAIRAAYPPSRLIAWTFYEPAPEEVPHTMDMLGQLAKDGFLYAWITDEPRLRRSALDGETSL